MTMTDNHNLEAAWAYHEATKHSYASIRSSPHFLDWRNRPLQFKIYPALAPMALPREVRQSGVAALSAIAESIPEQTDASPDLEAVAQLLYLSAGITRKRSYPGGELCFRAAACTGALYEVELYLVCGDLANLEAGVYHFAPAEFGLRRLRAGDYRRVLVEATGGEPAVAHAPLTIICTCTYWRNAWKYQARTYRHFGWDNGTLLANMLAVATALGLPGRCVTPISDLPSATGQIVQLSSLSDAEMPRDPIEQVIQRRGSTREFARSLISLPQLSTMLDRATRGVPADFLDPPGAQLNHLYLIVHAVEGLPPGAYVFHRSRGLLECLKQENFRAAAGYLGLEQELPADAAVDIFFLADLWPILQRFGNRRYRAAQLEAAILGGKLYPAAYAQRLGPPGLPVFDDDVTRFFSPHAASKSPT